MKFYIFFIFMMILNYISFFSSIYSDSKKSKLDKLDQPAIYYKIRGDYYRYLGYINEALDEYDKALILKANYAECYYWVAVIYFNKGLYIQSLYHINQAFKYTEFFDSIDLLFRLYFLEIDLLIVKDSVYSMDSIETKLNLLFNKLQYHDIKGHFLGKYFFYKSKYLTNYNFSTRLTWVNHAIRNNYNKDKVFYFLYLFYCSRNNNEKANRYFQSAIRLNANIVMEYYKSLLSNR